MNKLNCFAIVEINNQELELLDLSFTDTSNVEGIMEYVKNVVGIISKQRLVMIVIIERINFHK